MTLLVAVRDGDSVIVAADANVWHRDSASVPSWEGTAVKFRPLRETYALYGFFAAESPSTLLGAASREAGARPGPGPSRGGPVDGRSGRGAPPGAAAGGEAAGPACPGKTLDIEAETLAALLAAVADCDRNRERLAARLCWLARAGANRLLRAELAERARPGSEPVSAVRCRRQPERERCHVQLHAKSLSDELEGCRHRLSSSRWSRFGRAPTSCTLQYGRVPLFYMRYITRLGEVSLSTVCHRWRRLGPLTR